MAEYTFEELWPSDHGTSTGVVNDNPQYVPEEGGWGFWDEAYEFHRYYKTSGTFTSRKQAQKGLDKYCRDLRNVR